MRSFITDRIPKDILCDDGGSSLNYGDFELALPFILIEREAEGKLDS